MEKLLIFCVMFVLFAIGLYYLSEAIGAWQEIIIDPVRQLQAIR